MDVIAGCQGSDPVVAGLHSAIGIETAMNSSPVARALANRKLLAHNLFVMHCGKGIAL